MASTMTREDLKRLVKEAKAKKAKKKKKNLELDQDKIDEFRKSFNNRNKRYTGE